MIFETKFFEIPLKKGCKEIDKTAFWKQANVDPSNKLSTAKGCYIFGLRVGKGLVPYYVGKATNTFKQEVFHDSKLLRYERCMNSRKGTPVLILVVAVTKRTGKYTQGVKDDLIEWVESQLIHHAFKRNRNLINFQKIGYAKNVVIPGLFSTSTGRGINNNDSKNLRDMLFGKKQPQKKLRTGVRRKGRSLR